jgi:anti-sigma factor RsiW
MSPCNEHSIGILRYLDNDLGGKELGEFRAHLKGCADCRALLEEEQELSHVLHRSRPLYTAPAALRARVSADVARHTGRNRRPGQVYERIPHVVWQALRCAHCLTSWKVLAPAALLIALCLILIPETARQVRAADYVQTALTAHRNYLNGSLPPEIRSDSPEVVTAWVARKVPFHFCLPAARSIPDSKPVYQLTGARLLNYKESPAALITYETPKDKISLMVASDKSAVVAGGDAVPFGPLTFHYRREGGFEVITWSNHGLSYALVSNLYSSGRQSCLVCHQNMADHEAFRSVR